MLDCNFWKKQKNLSSAVQPVCVGHLSADSGRGWLCQAHPRNEPLLQTTLLPNTHIKRNVC